MSTSYITPKQTAELSNRQLYSLENGLSKGHFDLNDIGELLPGAIMVHNIQELKITYMNSWGCETLNHSMDEINAMGDLYYEKFFFPEETKWFIQGMFDYYKREDHSEIYSFFHRVRTGIAMQPSWYYAVCKFLRTDLENQKPDGLLLIANPVSGMGVMAKKVNKLLDENVFVAKNYKKFVMLTKREKEIIAFLAEGKSTNEISDILFISRHTVGTHRKNISKKLGISKFAELIKFATAFELCK